MAAGSELARKLDEEIDQFMDMLAAKRGPREENKGPVDIDKLVEELEQHPAFMKELPKGQVPEAIEALQAMKYDENDDPIERAMTHKEDGNKHFGLGKYRWACEAYTEGIKVRCEDLSLNAVLYSNRAASNARLGNHRSAFKDCVFARKFIKNHPKAVLRGAESLLTLGYASQTLKWLENADKTDFELTLLEKLEKIRENAFKKQKEEARDARKTKLKEEKDMKAKRELLDAFKSRHVTSDPPLPDDVATFDWSIIEVNLPQLDEVRRVQFDENGSLVYPVLLRYPNEGQTDFVRQFAENCTLEEQLAEVLAQPPEWDVHAAYRLNTVDVYYFHTTREERCKVSFGAKLSEIVSLKSFSLQNGLVILDILPK